MKNSILNLGTVLDKSQQQQINGGFPCYCNGKYVGDASSISQCWNACPSDPVIAAL